MYIHVYIYIYIEREKKHRVGGSETSCGGFPLIFDIVSTTQVAREVALFV